MVQAQQELEHRALACSGAADQRDLFARSDRHGEIFQNRLFAIAERDMRKLHIAVRGRFPLRRNRAFRLGKECVDPLDTGHGRLDRLDLHAQALDGGKDAGNVVDDGD